MLERPGTATPPLASGADVPAPSTEESSPSAGSAAGEIPAAVDPRSLAVLPFVNMSGDADNEYFSDGLTEELLNVLARIEGLKVAARTSSFYFKDQPGNTRDIARELGVSHLLEGSVRRSGDRLRITAQLISAADGFHLWSETYDRQLTDIFAVQDDIAAEVARALRVRLLGEAMPTVPRPPTGNVEAYTAYLRGMQALRSGGYDARDQAEAAFREALALDPDFAAAYAGLAQNWRMKAFSRMVRLEQALAEIEQLVARALELDPDQPRAHALQGFLVWADESGGDFYLTAARAERAEASFRRALELEPGQPEASQMLAVLLELSNRQEEATNVVRAAVERDPLSAELQMLLARRYLWSGRLEPAVQVVQRAISLAPHDPSPAGLLSYLLHLQGRVGEAIVTGTRALLLDPRNYGGPLMMAQYYLELGMTEAALPWLEAAERMAPEADDSRLVRALWHWRAGERGEAAALSAVAMDGTLGHIWSQRPLLFSMFAMHALEAGRPEDAFQRLLALEPTALDPVAPDEPINQDLFFLRALALPLLRAREGEPAVRERAGALLAQLERQAAGLPEHFVAWLSGWLYGALGQADDFVALILRADNGGYPMDYWIWAEAGLALLPDPDASAARAWVADKEAIRARERAWLAAPGRMPDPEAMLAEMARAAETAPEVEPQLMEQFGPRPRLEQ
jgi:TolB-like protein/Flp pilus assembly protein TadD